VNLSANKIKKINYLKWIMYNLFRILTDAVKDSFEEKIDYGFLCMSKWQHIF